MNNTPQIAYDRPRVEIERGDFKIDIGGYCFLLCSKHLRSLGAIQYRHLLLVLDSRGNDALWVTAETNDMEGESVVDPDASRHGTMQRSP